MDEVRLSIARLLNYCDELDSKEMYEAIQIVSKHIEKLEKELKEKDNVIHNNSDRNANRI